MLIEDMQKTSSKEEENYPIGFNTLGLIGCEDAAPSAHSPKKAARTVANCRRQQREWSLWNFDHTTDMARVWPHQRTTSEPVSIHDSCFYYSPMLPTAYRTMWLRWHLCTTYPCSSGKPSAFLGGLSNGRGHTHAPQQPRRRPAYPGMVGLTPACILVLGRHRRRRMPATHMQQRRRFAWRWRGVEETSALEVWGRRRQRFHANRSTMRQRSRLTNAYAASFGMAYVQAAAL